MKEEKDNSQVYNYALVSTHSNFLLKISKWILVDISNLTFLKLNSCSLPHPKLVPPITFAWTPNLGDKFDFFLSHLSPYTSL